MRKNGFTMTELLGVIVILGVLILVAFPPLVDQIRKSRGNLSDAAKDVIYNSVELYMKKHQNDYPIYATNTFCFSLEELVDSGDLEISLLDYETGKNLDLSQTVKVYVESTTNIEYEIVEENDCFIVDNTPITNSDFSGASVPVLDDGMIPVRWNGLNWVKADYRNPDNNNRWYNYNNRQWANVVVVNDLVRMDYKKGPVGMAIKEDDVLAYLVWIPRYHYVLFNVHSHDILNNPFPSDGIELFFEDASENKFDGESNGELLTHPAFTHDSKELSGFWVGKFETTGTTTIPTVKPSSISLRGRTLSEQDVTVKRFTNPMYGLSSTIDPRVMKNTEWGAVAYLSQSRYGKNSEIWLNPSTEYTGCSGDTIASSPEEGCSNYYSTIYGMEASTTGNVYGVYDMVGGASEMVMGVQYNSSGNNVILGSSGFSSSDIEEPYINRYQFGTTTNNIDAYGRRILGDATGEVHGWRGDKSVFINNNNSWFVRGGDYAEGTLAGVFAFDHFDGGTNTENKTVRIVISIEQ